MYHNYIAHQLKNFFRYNNALIAHIGVGVTILGITCSSVFQAEHKHSFLSNESVKVGKYILKLKNTEIIEKENFQELMATFIVYNDEKILSEIKPSKRYDHVSKIITTEAGIYHHWLQDFYIVLGNQKDNKWNVKIYQNPLVSFIWFGIMIMIFSGIMGIRKK